MFKRGFTLAEVLITLAIIGVVAAISIPSVISNTQQQEFKTALRKAVSVLNSAITMNMALDGESPYDNTDLYNYLSRHMSIIEKANLYNKYYITPPTSTSGTDTNQVFIQLTAWDLSFIEALGVKENFHSTKVQQLRPAWAFVQILFLNSNN